MAAERAAFEAGRLTFEAEKATLIERGDLAARALERAEQSVAAHQTQLTAWSARAADCDAERERILSETARQVAVATQDRETLDVLRLQHEEFRARLDEE
jgi:hypothetical protein